MTRSAVMLAALLVTGCGPVSPEQAARKARQQPSAGYVDPETGCEYLWIGMANGGAVPRYAADGRTVRGCRDGEEAGS